MPYTVYTLSNAEVVELVDTQRSERCGSNPVEVQILSSALQNVKHRVFDIQN